MSKTLQLEFFGEHVGGESFFKHLEALRRAGERFVDVLEVSGDIAIARASWFQYLEYLSLARCNGQWTIINILWRFQTPPAPR